MPGVAFDIGRQRNHVRHTMPAGILLRNNALFLYQKTALCLLIRACRLASGLAFSTGAAACGSSDWFIQ